MRLHGRLLQQVERAYGVRASSPVQHRAGHSPCSISSSGSLLTLLASMISKGEMPPPNVSTLTALAASIVAFAHPPRATAPISATNAVTKIILDLMCMFSL